LPTPTEGEIQGNLADEIAIPPAHLMNIGLTSASESTMLALFGKPGALTVDCSVPSDALRLLLVESVNVGPFQVSGMRAAVDSLKQVFAELATKHPRVHSEVRTDGLGMLCVRKRRGNSQKYSNHSWGTAIDLKFGAQETPYGKAAAQRGFLALYPIFNKFGWYWGAEFSGSSADSMHFE